MVVKALGTEFVIDGYDDYLKDFEEQALPEFAKEAESLLLEALDESETYSIEVHLEAEKTKSGENLKFDFFFYTPEEGDVYVYGLFTQE